ncbi:MAG: bifunctional methylenetetrahydrofolate dehydrogenase/methenyltetrahydrofolate cyclohydrolase, partial [Planctomycetota bacterium]
MSGVLVSADEIAKPFRDSIRDAVAALGRPVKLRGILASERRASGVYAEYTAKGCADVGIQFELAHVARLEVEAAIGAANDDPGVHGVIVYYPVFGGERDRTIQDVIAPEKDVEGLNSRWAYMLYQDERNVGEGRKAILPCTPLAIVKALEHLGAYAAGASPGTQVRGATATIFNRSEVVGRPLAAMLAHDGARVYSFDLDGALLYEGHKTAETTTTRAQALAESDIIITGVPSRDFELVRKEEVKPGAVCINFSTYKNMEDGVLERARAFLPRVGPITVSMLLRNT